MVRPVRSPRSTLRRVATLGASASLLLSVGAAVPIARAATEITVTTTNQEMNGDSECSLQEAIYSANYDDNKAPDVTSPGAFFTTGCAAGSGTDTIVLPAGAVFTYADPITDLDNFVGPAATPIVTSAIVIEGQGARLQRSALGRPTRAFVVGPTGDLTLHEVRVKGFAIKGGDGADGGGGGMGAGGAVYVQGGRLGIGWSTFEDNAVRGGNGSFNDSHAGGGGGGLSGTGGNANYAGGGGGGARGDGGDGGSQTGGGGGGTSTSGQTPEPGDRCGGRGGEYNELTGGADDGDNAEYPPFFCPGGGGGGGTERVPIFDPFSGGSGGDGSYGGGGGGAGEEADGGHGGFGGGGGGSGPGDNGGDGGFGGGGGNGQALDIGGGISVGGRGQGGTFAGDGAVNGGGGGAALGGAVFGYAATIDIVNSTFSGNSARRGLSGDPSGDDPASDGRAAGGAIFAVAGSLHVDGSTVAGNSTGEFDLDGNGDPTGLGGGGIVVYKPTTGESASLRLRNTIVANNGPFECYTRNGVSVTGSSTNLITDSRDNTHGDPHCAGVVESADPQLGALAITAPGRTPTLAIGAGSSAIDRADPATAPVDDQRGVIRGAAPDIGAFEFRGAPPQTTITLTPATPDGSNGWYRGPVTVNVSATDADSTVAQTRCDLDPAPEPAAFADLPDASCGLGAVSTDGTHAVYAASIDTEGNVEAPLVTATFKIDATKPVLDPTLSSTTVTLGQTGVTALPHATDATSGIASASCDPVDTTTPGVHSVQCSAADRAGNSASASVTYVVEYRILGFFEPAPGSKWLAGQTVPIKVALAGANETRIPDAAAAALASSCRVTFTASGAQTKSAQCLRYDSATDQFVYNWKLGKPLGAVTISVSVSYPGTATATRLSESIAVTRK